VRFIFALEKKFAYARFAIVARMSAGDFSPMTAEQSGRNVAQSAPHRNFKLSFS